MDQWSYFDEKYGAPFGKGAQCHVYRKGDLAVKVFTPGHELADMMREAYALSIVEGLGIPTSNLQAAYRDHGFLVMEMKYVSGKELMEVIIECLERGDTASVRRHLETMADMQIKLHAGLAHGLESATHVYAAFARLTDLEAPMKEKLQKLVERLPDGSSLCHNDYHARNILFDGQNYTVIDWDSASIGDPAGDLAHTYLTTLLTDEGLANQYLDIYCTKTGMDKARLDPWLPIHALMLYNALAKKEENAWLCQKLVPYLADIL